MAIDHPSSSGSAKPDCKPCPREPPPRAEAYPGHPNEVAARVAVDVAVALVDGDVVPVGGETGARTGSACASRSAAGPAYCAYASR